MADEKYDQQINYDRVFPWTQLFRSFRIAMDPKKLILAAAGIVTMWLGWYLLSLLFFYPRSEPRWDTWPDQTDAGYKDFKADRHKWNILYAAAGTHDYRADANVGAHEVRADANDVAQTATEWKKINDAITAARTQHPGVAVAQVTIVDEADGKKVARVIPLPVKGFGELRLWPGAEDRGPNPFLLVTGQAAVSWDRGSFWQWVLTRQVPVVIEPLVKFFRPIVFLLQPEAGFWNHIYFLLVLIWTAAVWAFFGGALTRMAAVEIARRGDKVTIAEALRFTWSRIISYFTAPLIPVGAIIAIVVFLILFGVVNLAGWGIGDLWSGLLWGIVLLAGVAMALIVIGLVAWPLMIATISTEGSDNFDALSRGYSYLYQSPWNYLWYSLVAIVYGAILIFFVGFMGSLLVYLGKWGVSQTPGSKYFNREPSYLFVYAPTSFGWRNLLLEGAQTPNGAAVVEDNGEINPDALAAYEGTYKWYNWVGAFLASVWVQVLFLLVLGFGYSYFWTASTFIYLLMRRKVDETDFDEIYLEEEEPEETYSMTPSPSAPPPPAPGAPAMQMVEAPTLRSSAPPPAPPPPPPPPPPPVHEPAGTAATNQPASSTAPPENLPPTGDGTRPSEGGSS
jgi:hypothetical protein